MSDIVTLECSCGSVKGKLNVTPSSFLHVCCLCCDCQGFIAHLDKKENVLDEHGGTELVQTYPALVEITAGLDNIRCVQLKKKGLYRWHTTCCNMPVANTMGSSIIPFVGIFVKFMQFPNEQKKIEVLGPVTLKAFGKYSVGEMPKDAHITFPISYVFQIFSFMLKGMLGKKHKPSPFFNGKMPATKAKVLS